MSLINQMLIDLEARQVPGSSVERVLDGLVPATVTRFSRHRIVALACLCVALAWWGQARLRLAQSSPAPPSVTDTPRVLPLPRMPQPVAAPNVVMLPLNPPRVQPAVPSVSNSGDEHSETPRIDALPARVESEAPKPASRRTSPARKPNPIDATDELRALARAIEASSSDGLAAITPPAAVSADPAVESPGTFRRVPALPEVSSGASVPGTNVPGINVQYQRAVNLVAAGQLERGAAVLKAYLIEHPQLATVRMLYAETLIKLGRRADAVATLRSGLARDPKHVPTARLLGHLLHDSGDFAQAIKVLRSAAPELRTNIDYYAFMAALYQRMSKHRAAIRLYRQIAAAKPNYSAAWIGIGISSIAIDEFAAATMAFRRALAIPTLAPSLRDYARNELTRLTNLE
jgi:Tetratricopeptide repeat